MRSVRRAALLGTPRVGVEIHRVGPTAGPRSLHLPAQRGAASRREASGAGVRSLADDVFPRSSSSRYRVSIRSNCPEQYIIDAALPSSANPDFLAVAAPRADSLRVSAEPTLRAHSCRPKRAKGFWPTLRGRGRTPRSARTILSRPPEKRERHPCRPRPASRRPRRCNHRRDRCTSRWTAHSAVAPSWSTSHRPRSARGCLRRRPRAMPSFRRVPPPRARCQQRRRDRARFGCN